MNRKKFNVTGLCVPELHYMVDIRERIDRIIADYIEQGSYFTINRARQYGKTTTLRLLQHALQKQYVVIRISFEGKEEYFASLQSLTGGLCRSFCEALSYTAPDMAYIFENFTETQYPLQELSRRITEFCQKADRKTVLMIDEVDKAADNDTFLSLLGMLRQMYLARLDYGAPAFDSVILARVHDIKNLKMKFRPEERHSYNSPWNIAAEFNIDMSFSAKDIMGMLEQYERDAKTGMDIRAVSELIYDYTSGYPYLVSRICKLMDERICTTEEFTTLSEVWTTAGVTASVKQIMKESNTLFDDMRKKIADYPTLRQMLYEILFYGRNFPYNPDNPAIDIGVMFGFIRESEGMAVIANRIFETRIYNLFLSEELMNSVTYQAGLLDKNQFVKNGYLDMELVLRKFTEHFSDVYAENDQKFLEENGRRLFLLYLKPIINGTGNYYIEARTRDMRRTDVIVDYRGRQYVIELKIWHGDEYNARGEQQLLGYLEDYHLTEGYMLSFNFNKKKQVGVKEIYISGRRIVEAVV